MIDQHLLEICQDMPAPSFVKNDLATSSAIILTLVHRQTPVQPTPFRSTPHPIHDTQLYIRSDVPQSYSIACCSIQNCAGGI